MENSVTQQGQGRPDLMTLPAEIRHMIWRLVIPTAVDIEFCREGSACNRKDGCEQSRLETAGHSNPPTLALLSMAVYRESMFFYRQQNFTLNYQEASCLSWFLKSIKNRTLRERLSVVRKRRKMNLQHQFELLDSGSGGLTAESIAKWTEENLMKRYFGVVKLIHCDLVWPSDKPVDDGEDVDGECSAVFEFEEAQAKLEAEQTC